MLTVVEIDKESVEYLGRHGMGCGFKYSGRRFFNNSI